MAKDKYISVKKGVDGYSFANVGLFRGLADGSFTAVYSLVLMGLFVNSLQNESIAASYIGVYASLFAMMCMMVSIISKELLSMCSKIRVIYISFLFVIFGNMMMFFSWNIWSFALFDFLSGIGSTLVWLLIPLFMSDFSKDIGMAKLNARYYFWVNIGCLVAPLITLNIAALYGDYKIGFLFSSLFYISGFLFLHSLKVQQQDKKIQKLHIWNAFVSLWKNAVIFFRTPKMFRAYLVAFEYWALFYLQLLYIPVVMAENGFSAKELSLLLSIIILPHILVDLFVGHIVTKVGSKIIIMLASGASMLLSVLAMFVSGWWLFFVFFVWGVAVALIEPVYDLLFFDNLKKDSHGQFYGVFKTTAYLANIIVPILGAICIAVTGITSFVWFVLFVVNIFTLFVLCRKV